MYIFIQFWLVYKVLTRLTWFTTLITHYTKLYQLLRIEFTLGNYQVVYLSILKPRSINIPILNN